MSDEASFRGFQKTRKGEVPASSPALPQLMANYDVEAGYTFAKALSMLAAKVVLGHSNSSKRNHHLQVLLKAVFRMATILSAG
jgi:hypothetical protein